MSKCFARSTFLPSGNRKNEKVYVPIASLPELSTCSASFCQSPPATNPPGGRPSSPSFGPWRTVCWSAAVSSVLCVTRGALPPSAVVSRDRRVAGASLANFIRSRRSKTSFFSMSTSASEKLQASSEPYASTPCQPQVPPAPGAYTSSRASPSSKAVVSSVHSAISRL